MMTDNETVAAIRSRGLVGPISQELIEDFRGAQMISRLSQEMRDNPDKIIANAFRFAVDLVEQWNGTPGLSDKEAEDRFGVPADFVCAVLTDTHAATPLSAALKLKWAFREVVSMDWSDAAVEDDPGESFRTALGAKVHIYERLFWSAIEDLQRMSVPPATIAEAEPLKVAA